MEDDICIGHIPHVKAPEKVWKVGRPRAIPSRLEPVVIELYKIGYGYRAIARRTSHQSGFYYN